jgi:hypothetical protein
VGPAVGCVWRPAGHSAEFTSTSPRRLACCSASPSPRRSARRCCWTICAPSPARWVRPLRQLRRGGSSRCGDGSWSDRPHPRMCSPATPHPGRRSQRHSLRGLHGSAALVQYEDRYGGVTEREIELQFLYYSLPVWYAMAWALLSHRPHSARPRATNHIPATPARPVPGRW